MQPASPTVSRIETKFAGEDSGSDDNGNGSVDGAEGHACRIADVVPDGWSARGTIGGSILHGPRRAMLRHE